MKIRVNRNQSKPPKRDYSNRNSDQTAQERMRAVLALRSLDPGQSVEFLGEQVTRDRVNSLIVAVRNMGIGASFSTAKISGGIGVWRTA